MYPTAGKAYTNRHCVYDGCVFHLQSNQRTMRLLFRNRHGDPAIQFRLSHMFLFVVLVAVVSSLHNVPWVAAGTGALLTIGYLHRLSQGRTSPLAAFAFVLVGPVAGTTIGVGYAILGKLKRVYVSHITYEVIQEFCLTMICAGLVAGAIVAVLAAIEKRQEWFNHL